MPGRIDRGSRDVLLLRLRLRALWLSAPARMFVPARRWYHRPLQAQWSRRVRRSCIPGLAVPLSPASLHRLSPPRRPLLTVLVMAALAVTGCGGSQSGGTAGRVSEFIGSGDRATLAGGGSTFAATMVEEWARLYRSHAPEVDVRYEAIGSGAGIRRLVDGTSDFGVTEALMTREQGRAAGWEGAVQVPVLGGGVAVAYNLPGVEGLRLSEDTLARMFSGAISRWDHPAIRRDNPSAQLPSIAVTPVHRSDISGTTLAFTRYLVTAGRDVWAAGAGTSVEWPGGREAAGSAGVIATIGAARGGIGYVAVGPARAARLQLAGVRNTAGEFVEPTASAIDSALIGASGSEEDLTLTVPDRQESPTAYPITVISHLVFRLGLPADKDAALRHFGVWILSEGQRSVTRLGFTPLPLPLLVRTLEGLQNGGTRPSR